MVIWITGRSGAGKTDLAQRLMSLLKARGRESVLIDGDVLRSSVSRDLGFSPEDRVENCRRAGVMANQVVQGGRVAICALMSPTREMRAAAWAEIEDSTILLVWKDAPLSDLKRRDGKGLYAREEAGEISSVSVDIEPPEDAQYFHVHWYNGDSWEKQMDHHARNILITAYMREEV